ncbi:ExeA family protein [uncultured Deefgea sp.]|uniref:ExeA family protein n=1 Tax=uncultured Deefgea sp. TaxID=1304914 RepID=UPI0026256993|nr:AAA family ATPase [uncultured Deefgea sp.]
MLKLKTILSNHKIKQSTLASHLSLSQATVAQLLNHGQWPKSLVRKDLEAAIVCFLYEAIASDWDSENLFEIVNEVDQSCSSTIDPEPQANPEEENMLLRKQGLTQVTRKHFSLFRDPFGEEVQSHDEVFVSPDIRYVREAMFQTAKHGGFMAVVGESGAGKSTLRRDLIDRIQREGQSIVVIEPYVLALEDNDIKGKTLKAGHIAEAILATLAPLENPKRSPEARFRQLHRALRDSRRAGHSHVLIIEEAHALPIPTIKHLKRFFELEDGFKKLLSIVLIGQPELAMKLSEQNQEVREVVQRCEVVTLAPLIDGQLEAYLKFKLDRIGKPMAELIDASGIAAVRERLTIAGQRKGQAEMSLLYPLAVGNLLTAAMNKAAEYGFPLVTGDVVKGV